VHAEAHRMLSPSFKAQPALRWGCVTPHRLNNSRCHSIDLLVHSLQLQLEQLSPDNPVFDRFSKERILAMVSYELDPLQTRERLR
jgi:hypothetical protein